MTDILQILICTYGFDGLERVASMTLPKLPEVGYIVSCQIPDGNYPDLPHQLQRSDIKVVFHVDRGLGLNRRHAWEASDACWVMLADDDLEYDAAQLRAAVQRLHQSDRDAIATFRAETGIGRVFPPDGHPLQEPFKNYNPISFEMAFRRRAVEEAGVRFSALTGVGAPYLTAGEESIFLARCLGKGLTGRHHALTTTVHHHPTTAERLSADAGFVRSCGAYIRIHYGLVEGFARSLLFAKRSDAPFGKALRWVMQGYIYSLIHNKQL